MSKHDDLARILRALAHPNRLAIFERLSESGLCCHTDAKGNTVCAIAEDFQLALSTVSHHLKELRDAGLITCERRGQQVLCAVNHATLEQVLTLFRPRERAGTSRVNDGQARSTGRRRVAARRGAAATRR